MSSKIHHATAKRAKSYGLTLDRVENEFVVYLDGGVLATHPSASVALDQAIKRMDGGVLDDQPPAHQANAVDTPVAENKPGRARKQKVARKQKDNQDEQKVEDDFEDNRDANEGEIDQEEDLPSSVVKAVYKARYRPFQQTCGDDLAMQLIDYLAPTDGSGERIDLNKLREFAEANGCWVGGYAHLNPGMQRMNVVNRLRAKVRKGHEIVWP
jgi:hypothetical protein